MYSAFFFSQVKEIEGADSVAEDPDFVPLACDLDQADTDIGDESGEGDTADDDEMEQQTDNKEEEGDGSDVSFSLLTKWTDIVINIGNGMCMVRGDSDSIVLTTAHRVNCGW